MVRGDKPGYGESGRRSGRAGCRRPRPRARSTGTTSIGIYLYILLNVLVDTTFRAVSDPTRRRILDLLQQGERSVSELVGEFSISQPALSQHLKVLREADLVRFRAEGRARIYSINSEPLHEVAEWASRYRRVWGRKFEAFDG